MELELDFVQSLIKLMSEHDLRELDLEEGGRRIHLLRGSKSSDVPQPVQAVMPAMMPAMPAMPAVQAAAPVAAPAAAEAEAAAPGVDANVKVIDSPMVGTFYRAPTPDSEAFVQVGDKVTEDTTLAILEAMKVMNEIKAECSGEIVDIRVVNGESVEYGQALFHIRLDND